MQNRMVDIYIWIKIEERKSGKERYKLSSHNSLLSLLLFLGGITCNKCGVSPIRGTRYKCANCVDFDLCEMCEGSNSHLTTHVFLKIRIPIPPLANPRSALLPAFYPGNDENSRWTLSSDKIRELQEKTHCKFMSINVMITRTNRGKISIYS